MIRRTLEIGLRPYRREDLEAVRAADERLRIQVMDQATTGDDVLQELTLQIIESIEVLDALHASAAVKTPSDHSSHTAQQSQNPNGVNPCN